MKIILIFISFLVINIASAEPSKAFDSYKKIQMGLESKDASLVQSGCKDNESKFFCNMAFFLERKKAATEFVHELPVDEKSVKEFFAYDQRISHELYLNKMPNPYGNGVAFVIINQVVNLSYSLPVMRFLTC